MAKSFRDLAGIPPTVATPSNSTLVIIDAQNEYASGALAVKQVASSRANISALLERYRAASGHIAHVVHSVPEGTPVFTPGTPLAEEFGELAPRSTAESGGKEVLISKQHPGAFAETGLGNFVKGTGKKVVVLVGYMAHVCVSTTAREASQRGLEVVVVGDAVGDRDIPGGSGEEVTKVSVICDHYVFFPFGLHCCPFFLFFARKMETPTPPPVSFVRFLGVSMGGAPGEVCFWL